MTLPRPEDHRIMTKLSDTQRILLAHAAQRPDGNLLPLPTTLKPGGGLARAMAALLRAGLTKEREITDTAASYRREGDVHYGLFVTPSGLGAIGIDAEDLPEMPSVTDDKPVTDSPAGAGKGSGKRVSKAGHVLTLLARPDGATLAELIEATGWLPHSTRAALTGLRKKGYDIARGKRDGATCYRIGTAA